MMKVNESATIIFMQYWFGKKTVKGIK